MQLRPWLSRFLALALAATPAAAQEFNIFTPWQRSNVVALTRSSACATDTASATTYNNAAFQALNTGLTATDTAYVVIAVGATDNANSFTVNSATINGVAATSVVTTSGTTESGAARMFISATPISNAATVNVSTTMSEAVTAAEVCAWGLKNLNSATALSTANNFSNSAASIALTTGTTDAAGFVLGFCQHSGTAGQTVTWGVLTERIEDSSFADASYSIADAAGTGSSMSNTCDYTGSGDVQGVAAAFR